MKFICAIALIAAANAVKIQSEYPVWGVFTPSPEVNAIVKKGNSDFSDGEVEKAESMMKDTTMYSHFVVHKKRLPHQHIDEKANTAEFTTGSLAELAVNKTKLLSMKDIGDSIKLVGKANSGM